MLHLRLLTRLSLGLSFAISLGMLGCTETPPPAETPSENSAAATSTPDATATESPSAPADPADAVALVEAAAQKVERDAQGRIRTIDLRECTVTPELLAALPQLPQLNSLLLNKVSLSDDDLQPIGQCVALTNLDLRGCPLGNPAMQHLVGLKNLRALRLSGESGATTIDDDGLAAIGELTSLKALLLDFLWVSGAGLAELDGLEDLTELYLAGTLVGDQDLVELQRFPRLKKLRVSKLSQVSGPGIQEIAQLTALEDLDLSENSSIFDDDLAGLAELTNLRRLNLWRVPVGDAGVAHLQDLTELRWLNLDNTLLTDAGLDALAGMQKLTFLHLGSTAVSDAGLPKLAGLKSLQDLKVTRTAVTEAGVESLQESLPNTEIQLKYLGGN